MKLKLKNLRINRKKIPIYEHLEFDLKHTTYADRLLWLEQANDFLRSLKKIKIVKH